MEQDKVAFLEEFKLKLDKQNKIINTLKKEKNALNEDLAVVRCNNHSRRDKKIVKKINILVDELGKCNNVLKIAKDDSKELEVQIRKVNFFLYFTFIFI